MQILSQKKSKLDSDSYNMLGGSPLRENSGHSDSDTSNSSYDSDAYHRGNYDDRRKNRREKYSSDNYYRNNKNNQRDKRDKEEKELCLMFSEHGRCPDVSAFNYFFTPETNKIHINSYFYLKNFREISVNGSTKYVLPKRWSYASFI